jgi:ketosteroid isomerase-like protein
VSPEHIKKTLRDLYAARVRGDLAGVMLHFASDGVFKMNAGGTNVAGLNAILIGRDVVTPVIRELMETWRFDDWEEKSLLVEGDKALLYWTARVTCAPTGKTGKFEVFDYVVFREGEIVEFYQNTDTALLMALASPD